jgi:hypothetical protein
LARALTLLFASSAILATLAAGCGSGRDSMVVRERFEAVQVPHRIAGTASRAGQVVRNNCMISAVYKVREATGTAFLTQSQLVHLRLRLTKRGMTYELECLGPLIAELPVAASKVEATAHDLSDARHRSLSVRTHASSIQLAPGRPLRPAPEKQLVVLEWPRRLGSAHDDYRVELGFQLPKARFVRERVVYTASISCGGSRYLQPVVPLTSDLGFVNAYTVPEDGKPFDFILPRLATGISSHAEMTRTLACDRSG